MAFNISATAPKAGAAISFNAISIKASAPAAAASLSFSSIISFKISAQASAAVANLKFNEFFSIKASVPISKASLSFIQPTFFNIKASVKASAATIKIGSAFAFVIKASAKASAASMVFGQPTQFSIYAATKAPSAYILLAQVTTDLFAVLAMNLSNKLISFYQNYNFNSATNFNGQNIAAGADGLYLLSGVDDNGTEIDASILLGDYDFGSNNEKVLPRLYVNYSGDGELQVSVATDEGEMKGPFDVPAPHETKLQTRRAKIPLGLRGSHWQYLIQNVQGSRVNIQNVELQFVKSQRRLH